MREKNLSWAGIRVGEKCERYLCAMPCQPPPSPFKWLLTCHFFADTGRKSFFWRTASSGTTATRKSSSPDRPPPPVPGRRASSTRRRQLEIQRQAFCDVLCLVVTSLDQENPKSDENEQKFESWASQIFFSLEIKSDSIISPENQDDLICKKKFPHPVPF